MQVDVEKLRGDAAAARVPQHVRAGEIVLDPFELLGIRRLRLHPVDLGQDLLQRRSRLRRGDIGVLRPVGVAIPGRQLAVG